LLRALLLLAILWWAWSAYAWLTNTLDPDEGGVRIAMLAAIAAMLVTSLAAPRAFGRDGMTFAVAYIVVRGFHLVLYALAGRDDRDLLGAVLRVVPTVALGGVFLVAAAFLDGSAKLACWAAAVAIDYGGVLFGNMRGWRLSPDHFVERFGEIILIALGESIVALGVGAAAVRLDADVIAAALPRGARADPRPAPGALRRAQLLEERDDAFADLVADPAHDLHAPTGGVVNRPVVVAGARVAGAGIAATHRHDDVDDAQHVVGPRLRAFGADVDAGFEHHRDCDRVDAIRRLGTGGPRPRAAVREVLEPAERHLRATGVVDAEEQHRLHDARSGDTTSASTTVGWRKRASATAPSAPAISATTNGGADDGRMPANVLLRVRAIVTAGLAKDVDDVNQYAAAM
jgi:hypothetical protein